MSFSKQVLDEIKSSSSILDFAGSIKGFVSVGGNKYKACCPFHGEKTPSFHIDSSQQLFHCFGCGVGGDIIHLVQKLEGIEFVDAVKLLAERAGIKIEFSEVTSKQEEQNEKIYKIFQSAADFYRKGMYEISNKDVKDYIKKRKLNESTLEMFGFGFASGGSELFSFLKKAGFEKDDILKSGLVKEKGGNVFDFFFNRIVIPIRNSSNKVIGFGARLFKDIPDAPKYVNSSESPVFKKSEILFNMASARMFCSAKKQHLVVVEGYMDCIVATQFGYGAIVAPLGTSITVQQIKNIIQVDKNPIICLNSDNAGMNAMLRCAKLFLPEIKSGVFPSFAMLENIKDIKDVDDFLFSFPNQQDSINAFEKLLTNALEIQEFLWITISKEKDSRNPNDMSILEGEVAGLVSLIKDESVKKSYARFFKNKIYELGRSNFYNKNSNTKQKASMPMHKQEIRRVLESKAPMEVLGYVRFYNIYMLIIFLAFPFCLLYVLEEGESDGSSAFDTGIAEILKLKNLILNGHFYEYLGEAQEDVSSAVNDIASMAGEELSSFNGSFIEFIKHKWKSIFETDGTSFFSKESININIIKNKKLASDVNYVLEYLSKTCVSLPSSLEELVSFLKEIKKKTLLCEIEDKIKDVGGDVQKLVRLIDEKNKIMNE